jgi:hypothetical protein
MEKKDLLIAAVSLFAILGISAAAILLILILFTAGSPMVLIGILAGLGIWGIFVILSVFFAVLSGWYIIYALIRNFICPEKETVQKGNYSIERIKKA